MEPLWQPTSPSCDLIGNVHEIGGQHGWMMLNEDQTMWATAGDLVCPLKTLQVSKPQCPLLYTEVMLTSWHHCNQGSLLTCSGKVRTNQTALTFYYYVYLLLSSWSEERCKLRWKQIVSWASQHPSVSHATRCSQEACVWAPHSLHRKKLLRRIAGI